MADLKDLIAFVDDELPALSKDFPLKCVCGNRDEGKPGDPCSAECGRAPFMTLDVAALIVRAYRSGWERGVWCLIGGSERTYREVVAIGPPLDFARVDLGSSPRHERRRIVPPKSDRTLRDVRGERDDG